MPENFRMKKSFAGTGALFVLTGVMLGAFGAHGLKKLVSPERVESFMTGTEYQIYHGIGILIVWLAAQHHRHPLFKWAARCFAAGIFLFSGSIYLLSTSEISGIPASFLGPVTPLGGLTFITGWVLTLIAFFSKPWKI